MSNFRLRKTGPQLYNVELRNREAWVGIGSIRKGATLWQATRNGKFIGCETTRREAMRLVVGR